MNLNVPLPPPYYRETWDYKHANTENIQKDVSMFDWQKAFKNNFIQHKTKKFDCKYPEWMNSIISSLEKRTKYTKKVYKNPSDYNKDLLNSQENECTRLIIQAKEKHVAKMSAKLHNPNTAPNILIHHK